MQAQTHPHPTTPQPNLHEQPKDRATCYVQCIFNLQPTPRTVCIMDTAHYSLTLHLSWSMAACLAWAHSRCSASSCSPQPLTARTTSAASPRALLPGLCASSWRAAATAGHTATSFTSCTVLLALSYTNVGTTTSGCPSAASGTPMISHALMRDPCSAWVAAALPGAHSACTCPAALLGRGSSSSGSSVLCAVTVAPVSPPSVLPALTTRPMSAPSLNSGAISLGTYPTCLPDKVCTATAFLSYWFPGSLKSSRL
mmetsp:Transcript_19343/g.49202  ORF Transcript_19343/g.49202 Transcript_19343/m.49202 type:complete len:255 (+) Transcript_19343:1566-2330(+)